MQCHFGSQFTEKEMIVSGRAAGNRETTVIQMESKGKQNCPRGADKKELARDSGKCHRSIKTGKVHNKGTEAGGKFSKKDKEALSCQAYRTRENRGGKRKIYIYCKCFI